MWIIETVNIDMFIFSVSHDYFVFVHVDASGSAKISLRPDNEDSKRIKTKRKPKTKRRSKLVVSDSDDIALQLNMINVFQKTSKYRNEPHRCLCMPPSLRNQTPHRTSTTESRVAENLLRLFVLVNINALLSRHRTNMMNAIIAVSRGVDSARQAGRKYKVSARSIGRYIAALKEMRAKCDSIPEHDARSINPSQPMSIRLPSADLAISTIHSPSDIHAANKLLVLLSSGVGLAPPLSGVGFAPPLSGVGLAPPLSGVGLAPPLSGVGLAPPLSGVGLAPALSGVGLAPPVSGVGLAPPVSGVGLAPPVSDADSARKVNVPPHPNSSKQVPEPDISCAVSSSNKKVLI